MRVITTARNKQTKNCYSFIGVVAGLVVILVLFFLKIKKPIEDNKCFKDEVLQINPKTPINAVDYDYKTNATHSVPHGKLVNYAASTNAVILNPGRLTLPDGQVVKFKPPKEGETIKVFANGHVFECDSEGGFVDITPKRVFDNDFEERLVGIAVDGGSFIPAFLKQHSEEEILPILEKPITIFDDDPEEVIAKKEAVAEYKEVIKTYLADGGKWADFVDDVAAYAEDDRNYKGMAMSKISHMLHENKIDEAIQFLNSFDELMEEKGFSKIVLPVRLQKRLEDASKNLECQQ